MPANLPRAELSKNQPLSASSIDSLKWESSAEKRLPEKSFVRPGLAPWAWGRLRQSKRVERQFPICRVLTAQPATSLGESVCCHCPLLPRGGFRLRTAPFYSLQAGQARPTADSRSTGRPCVGQRQVTGGAQGTASPAVAIPQSGEASAFTWSPSLSQDCQVFGNSRLSSEAELDRGSVKVKGSVAGPRGGLQVDLVSGQMSI